MSQHWREALGDGSLRRLVGADALTRAWSLVRQGVVHDVEIDSDELVIAGRVRGSHRDDYTVTVRLGQTTDGSWSVFRSSCTCPVARDCKHAAAILLVARHELSTVAHRELPAWERTMTKLLADRRPVGVEPEPLALEFGLERIPALRGYGGRQELRIRPARRGRSGSWIRSGISWEDLDHVARTYRVEHRDLLLQFRSAIGSAARYALPRNGWLGLSTVASVFWSLLDQAGPAGLEIISAQPLTGPFRSAERATVTLDARRAGAAGLLVGPEVRLEGHRLPLPSVGLIGDPAHGIFLVEEGEADQERLVMAALGEPLGRDLRQLVLNAQALIVPAADEQRFLVDFVPGLRRQLSVGSSDDSVTLPQSVDPRLGLTVTFRGGHRVRLDWTIHYDVAGETRTFDLDDPLRTTGMDLRSATSAAEARVGGSGLRDAEAELALLRNLPLPYETAPQLAAPRQLWEEDRPAAHSLLDGLVAVTFVQQQLPALEKLGVTVTLAGEVLDYRFSDAAPQVEIATVERPDSADWFDLHVAVTVEGERVPFEPLFVALSRNESCLILDNGLYFELDRPQFDQLRTLIEESRGLQERDVPELRINRFQASLWSELVDLGVVVAESARWAHTVRGLNQVELPVDRAAPATLTAELRPYQLAGFQWLYFLWSAELGGILADDMGLGKTLQTLALMAQVRLEHPDGPPFLVVAPTSVVSGWVAEAARFAPELRTVGVQQSQAKARRPLAERVAGADLVVTSYALLRIDQEAFADQDWAGMILDEAQFVKNFRAKTYQSARRVPAPFKLAITGTPMENNLMDLWALLSITAPGLFPSPERFSAFYRRPIERDHDSDRLALLRRRIKPVLLRRTKEAVAADLPPKQEQVLEVELDPRHMRIYQTHLQRERQKVLGLIDDLDRNRFTILRSLTLLRRLSLDPGLLSASDRGVPAAKVEVLLADLAEITAEGHRALVFSQFTSFLGRIRDRLSGAGISYAYLDGRTRDRDEAIRSFREGSASVFLISLKAGGFGLNLTEADYCFILDPWWNPATEAQAVDRAHRIGQTKTVMVYRLVARDTIEEKVMRLKAAKEQLFGAVFAADQLNTGQLSAEEIRELLAV